MDPSFGGPMASTAGLRGGPAGAAGDEEEESLPATFEVKQTTFTIQFCWTENRLSERLAAQEEAARLKAEADAAAAANAPPVEAVEEEAVEEVPAEGAAPADA